MSLEEFDLRSSFGTSEIKRRKRAYVKQFERHLAQLKSGCRWIPDDEVISLPYRGLNRSSIEVIMLDGKAYAIAGNMVAREKTEIPFLPAAAPEVIDDGTIDYKKFAVRFTVKLASEKGSFAVRAVSDPEGGSSLECQLSKVPSVDRDNLPRTVIISITGSLVEETAKEFVIEWYGGGKLTIPRSHAEGDWDLLQVGQWFEATVSRRMNGEVVHAMLIGPIDEPEGFSEEELTTSYSSIPAAQLDPVK